MLTRQQTLVCSLACPAWHLNHPTMAGSLGTDLLTGINKFLSTPTCSPFALGTTLLSSMSHLFPNSILSTSSLACYNEITDRITHLPQHAANSCCNFGSPHCSKSRRTLTHAQLTNSFLSPNKDRQKSFFRPYPENKELVYPGSGIRQRHGDRTATIPASVILPLPFYLCSLSVKSSFLKRIKCCFATDSPSIRGANPGWAAFSDMGKAAASCLALRSLRFFVRWTHTLTETMLQRPKHWRTK